jgi:hypothetical protein
MLRTTGPYGVPNHLKNKVARVSNHKFDIDIAELNFRKFTTDYGIDKYAELAKAMFRELVESVEASGVRVQKSSKSSPMRVSKSNISRLPEFGAYKVEWSNGQKAIFTTWFEAEEKTGNLKIVAGIGLPMKSDKEGHVLVRMIGKEKKSTYLTLRGHAISRYLERSGKDSNYGKAVGELCRLHNLWKTGKLSPEHDLRISQYESKNSRLMDVVETYIRHEDLSEKP